MFDAESNEEIHSNMEQDCNDASAHGRDKCLLLDLPAELRNRIYEYALIESSPSDPIIITSDLKQPALLSTCRQIRNESLSLWYKGNQFGAELRNCEASLLMKFEQHTKQVIGERLRRLVRMDGKNWKNLLAWCEAIFQDKSLGIGQVERSFILKNTESTGTVI